MGFGKNYSLLEQYYETKYEISSVYDEHYFDGPVPVMML